MPYLPQLDPAFAKLAKPAQRALMGAGIFTPKDLAKHTRAEVAALHGIGPSAFPILESALREAGLTFKAE
jgi:predicted flap endonuclease-1-like 5' DNA nuclease